LREINAPRGKFYIQESIQEIGIGRYNDFTKYLVQEAGIGSDIMSVERHFRLLDSFLAAGDIEKARAERTNLHFNLMLAISKVNITQYSTALFVYSINDERIEDYTEEGLKRVVDKLDKIGVTQGLVEETLIAIKKKLIPS
jgi:hypothetical protein